MSDSIDRNTVQQVARLAKIQLSDQELDEASRHLADILQYVGQLDQVELPDDVEPFFGATETVNAIRADEIRPSTDRSKILENAPETDSEFYVVPPVFK